MSLSKTQLLILLGILIALFFLLGWHDYLSLTYLKQQHEAIMAYRSANPKLSILIYSFVYIVVTGLSLPGATILTLAGGAIFGLFWGTVIVSIASTIGATAAFLAARYLFRDSLEEKFATQLAAINKGIEKDGGYYLFTLRLVPLFPFFAINLLMGLTKMDTGTFFWGSQVGMLAGTIVYVNAGTQLGAIQSLADINSPALIGSFILLGLFPLAAKKYVEYRDNARNQA